MIRKLSIMTIMTCLTLSLFAGEDAQLTKVLEGNHRPETDKARDDYRKPAETLAFFGLKPDMTVVEVWPGGGWYTQILAPYLKAQGKLIPLTYDQNPETQAKWMARVNKEFDDIFSANPDTYGQLKAVGWVLPNKNEATIAEDGSVDMILDFRNAHNWYRWGGDDMVAAWFKALKKGGIVGIVDHRMDEGRDYDPKNGYIHEKTIIELMEKHGFKLAGKSDHLANPKDTKDHPSGVWSLPPVLARGEENRDKYLAIGESDRMTLKFVKP